MATVTCRNCGSEVSSRLITCPKCAEPLGFHDRQDEAFQKTGTEPHGEGGMRPADVNPTPSDRVDPQPPPEEPVAEPSSKSGTGGFGLARIISAVIFLVFMLGVVGVDLPFFGGGSLSEAEEHYNKGVDLHNEGRYADAIAEYTKAIELDGKLANAFWNRAVAYSLLGEPLKALVDFETAVSLDPDLCKRDQAGIIPSC